MKVYLLIVFAFLSSNALSLLAQDNVYPTTGNVGIGISNPYYKLQIITGINEDRSIGFSSSDSYISGRSSLIYTASGSGAGIFQNAGNLFIQPRTTVARGLYFNTFNGTSIDNRLAIDANGNIGIGQSEPDFKLHIRTGDNMDRSIGFANADNYVSNQSSLIYTAGGSGTGIFQLAGNLLIQPRTSAARGIYFNTYDGQVLETKMAISANGNIGIGVVNPVHKLAVKGLIHSEEVLVDLNVEGPDYVFEESYSLKDLSSLEEYIKENKHLPEVPSATQFKVEGIKVGEMEMLLLKKVEELTLYVINLKKELDEANKKIAQLQ